MKFACVKMADEVVVVRLKVDSAIRLLNNWGQNDSVPFAISVWKAIISLECIFLYLL